MPRSETVKIGNEIKRMIKNRFSDKITKIKTRLNKHGTWKIEIDTNILNDWQIYNFNSKDYVQIGKKPYKEIEDWFNSNSNYKKYRIAWEHSVNEELVKMKQEIGKMIFDKYKDLIGSYYDDFSDKRHLLIVKVNPL